MYMAILSDHWETIQVPLIRLIEEGVGERLSARLKQLIYAIEIIRVEEFIAGPHYQFMGRKEVDRRAMARAFIAKAIYNLPTTELLIEMLLHHRTMRQICGFERQNDVPSASTFSRAFAEFAQMKLGDKVHEALVRTQVGDQIVMHVSRDSTEVQAREKPTKKETAAPEPKRKRGRPKKGEELPPKEPKRIEKQLTQTLEEAIAELPQVCDIGSKRNSKGHKHSWAGYKAHIDYAGGSIPLSVITTSASLHDSQVAIPLARMTAKRVASCYDLMDSAYDAAAIRKISEELGHVAIIDANKRRSKKVPMEPDRARRYKDRSAAERGNSRLKDEFGLRHLRVRGHAKAHMHIMFGILALFADQLMNVMSG